MDKNKEVIEILKRKIEFYYSMNLSCHIKLIPNGFVNGKIISGLNEDGQCFVFEDRRDWIGNKRIFIEEIFDIEDYREEGE